MRKLLNISMLLLMLVATTLSGQAREIRNLWKTIPDSVILGIDNVRRLEMLDLIDYKVKSEVANRFGSQSVMDTITSNYLHVDVSKSSSLSLSLLPMVKGDTIVCMVQTYKAPQTESKISFFDLSWHQLDAVNYLPFTSLAETIDSLIECPDTMSRERFNELTNGIVAPLVAIETSAEHNDISLSLSIPFADKDNKEAVVSILRERRLSWNGEKYIYKEE